MNLRPLGEKSITDKNRQTPTGLHEYLTTTDHNRPDPTEFTDTKWTDSVLIDFNVHCGLHNVQSLLGYAADAVRQRLSLDHAEQYAERILKCGPLPAGTGTCLVSAQLPSTDRISWVNRREVPMRRRYLSPDQVDDAIHLYNLGWSLARVGQHLGVNHTTVLNKLRERGIRTRDTHGRPRVETGDLR